MAYNPSIHTASNKPYGVTNKPVDARYWYYDSSLYIYRPYENIAEVLSYLIANDRKGATVQIGTAEYWWPNSSDLSDAGLVLKATLGELILIPAGENPYTLVNGTDFIATSLRPIAVQFQPWVYPDTDDTKETTDGACLRTDYQFSDSAKDALVSIDVWVSDESVDTWIRLY